MIAHNPGHEGLGSSGSSAITKDCFQVSFIIWESYFSGFQLGTPFSGQVLELFESVSNSNTRRTLLHITEVANQPPEAEIFEKTKVQNSIFSGKKVDFLKVHNSIFSGEKSGFFEAHKSTCRTSQPRLAPGI